jgi:hypothetical protein
MLVTLSRGAVAETVSIAWDANVETDVAGYRVYYGNSPGAYSKTVDVGNTTTATLQNLTPGATYYLATTAYNTSGVESLPSDEVVYTNQLPSVALTAPGNGAQFTAPAIITVTADAADADGTISLVEFYNGSTKIGQSSVAPYVITWSGVASGKYALSAIAYDNAGAPAKSSAVSISVNVGIPAAPASVVASIASSSSANLSWSASSGASTYNIKRATTSGGSYTTVATGCTAPNYTDSGLTAGATYFYVVSAVNTAGESANSTQVSLTLGGAIPSPWTQCDVGPCGAAGSAIYSGGTFWIDGSGAKLGAKADEFHHVWQFATGDCSVVARVAAVENTDAGAKAGIMIRESGAAGSRYAGVFITPDKGALFQRRTSSGGNTVSSSVNGVDTPAWIKLTRTGNTFRAYYSADGVSWSQFGGNRSITMTANVSIGLVVSSHLDGTLCTATIDSVTASP